MNKAMEYSVNDVEGLDETTVLGEKTGTVADREAMARLGKEQLFKVSIFDRNTGLSADFHFSVTLAFCPFLVSP
jgi:hypothetical protein